MSDDERFCPLEHPEHPDTPSKAGRGSVLCGGHLTKLEVSLEQIATFEQDADGAGYESSVSRHDGAPVTGSAEKPLPIDLRKVGDFERITIADAREILLSWSLNVAEARHLSPPRRRRIVRMRPCGAQQACGLRKCQEACQDQQMRPGSELESFCDFLTRNLDWICAQYFAQAFAEEMFALRARANSILRPSGNREFPVGECIEPVNGLRCGGVMWARITPSDAQFMAAADLVCDRCGHQVDSGDWIVYGHRLKKMEAEAVAHEKRHAGSSAA